MPFAEAIDNSILDHYTKKAVWSQPNEIWVGLSKTTPTKTGGNVTEPSSGGYKRVQIPPADWISAASSATENNTTGSHAFAQATADYLSGSDLTDMVLYTDSVGANTFIGFKALTVAKPVLNGDTAKFLDGDIDLAIGGS
jgi:hypothetical protein